MSVIVVDDEPLVRLSTAETLRLVGFHVLEANNTSEALFLLATVDEVDAIVADVVMPGAANGYWLAWRARTSHPNLAVVVVSGVVYPSVGQLPQDTRFLSKPVDARKLVEELRSAIQIRSEAIRALDAGP